MRIREIELLLSISGLPYMSINMVILCVSLLISSIVANLECLLRFRASRMMQYRVLFLIRMTDRPRRYIVNVLTTIYPNFEYSEQLLLLYV